MFDDEYTDLPEEPELAFLKLEKKFHIELNEALDRLSLNEGGSSDPYYLSYINKTAAAAKALGLEIYKNHQVPSFNDSRIWTYYQDFNSFTEHYVIQIQIQHGRRIRGFSVQLDLTTKTKIRHYIDQIKSIIDRLEVPIPKKEALIARINALADEVDRDRTRFDAYAGLALEIATTGGAIAKKLAPARRLFDSIANLLGQAKQAEDARPSLSAPVERKRLEAPRQQIDASKRTTVDLDDEIPF